MLTKQTKDWNGYKMSVKVRSINVSNESRKNNRRNVMVGKNFIEN